MLKRGFEWLLRVNGDVTLVTLSSAFNGNSDVHVNSKCNDLVGESFDLLVIVFISKWNPPLAFWIVVRSLLQQNDVGLLGGKSDGFKNDFLEGSSFILAIDLNFSGIAWIVQFQSFFVFVLNGFLVFFMIFLSSFIWLLFFLLLLSLFFLLVFFLVVGLFFLFNFYLWLDFNFLIFFGLIIILLEIIHSVLLLNNKQFGVNNFFHFFWSWRLWLVRLLVSAWGRLAILLLWVWLWNTWSLKRQLSLVAHFDWIRGQMLRSILMARMKHWLAKFFTVMKFLSSNQVQIS